MRRIAQALLVSLVAALGACSTAPKPQELLALEQLRAGERFSEAQKKQAALATESEDAFKKATEAWQDSELEAAKHFAVLGTVKLRTALALVAQQTTIARADRARVELGRVQAERASVEVKLAEVTEKIRLHQQLTAARQAIKERDAELSEAQQLAAAEQKVSKAQLSLKMADTVEAAKYAPDSYSLAQAMLEKANVALTGKHAADASASADIAGAKAEAAYQVARPLYLQAKQTAARQAQDQALQRDAAAISGVNVRLQATGQTQQLIIPVYNLFKRSSTTPLPEKLSVLSAVGELLKRYPSYPAIINGYTSHAVRANQRYPVSLARAQQVANHFVSMGLPLKHFAIAGLGGENLFGRKLSPVNERVEIVLLFQ